MSTSISKFFIVESKLVLEGRGNNSLDDLLRRAAGALGNVEGASFVPGGKRAASFLEGKINARRITLTHPAFSEEKGYSNSWLSLSADSYGKTSSVIFVGIHMGRPGEQMDLEWEIGLALVPRLVGALTPTMGFMNGRLVDVEKSVLPSQAAMRGSPLPSQFTPWTYIDGAGLSEDLKKQLALLPAPVSAPLAGGWVVHALTKLNDPVSPEFLEALNKLQNPPVRFIHPILTVRR